MFEYLESLITASSGWAYVALFVLTFLEGETILILAGILAAKHDADMVQGGLNIWYCMISAFLGSMAGDQTVFFISRYHADWMMRKIARYRGKIDKVLLMLEGHSTWLLLSFRFFYGLRNIVSIAVGLSRVSVFKFMLLNAIGSLIWANCFAFGGYFLGNAIKEYLHEALAFAIVAAVVFYVTRRILRRTSARLDPPAPPAAPET